MNKSILEHIIGISNKLNILLFDVYDGKWILKPLKQSLDILYKHILFLHENMCKQIFISNTMHNFDQAKQILSEHQCKLYLIDKLQKYVVKFFRRKISVIEEFSNKDD